MSVAKQDPIEFCHVNRKWAVPSSLYVQSIAPCRKTASQEASARRTCGEINRAARVYCPQAT
jgi:hypothetical protein